MEKTARNYSKVGVARVARVPFIIGPITFSAYLVIFVIFVHDTNVPLIIIMPFNHQPVNLRVSFTLASVKTLYQNISSDTWR